jgi:hypothetical protein
MNPVSWPLTWIVLNDDGPMTKDRGRNRFGSGMAKDPRDPRLDFGENCCLLQVSREAKLLPLLSIYF